MVVFPGCKINLGLHILNKRKDGYHNLETVFYPVPYTDALEIIASPDIETLSFTTTGLTVDGEPNHNLCIKAYWLLKKDFPQLPFVQMHLHKCILMGAGLGGGSSDAAFTLQLLNTKFQLQITAEKLIDYAAQLGSDCAFFILNQPCVATGRGEILQPVALNLSGYKLALINPGIHVSTKEAFGLLQPARSERASLLEIIQQPVGTWRTMLTNDFEAPVCNAWPVIKQIKDSLYSHGATYAAMTGSGSSVFGLFSKAVFPTLTIDTPFFVRVINL